MRGGSLYPKKHISPVQIQARCLVCYDLELSPSFELINQDGEVESFRGRRPFLSRAILVLSLIAFADI
ncbi:hypothetical protein MLD38_019280 [Melastoma candidum]|uniref:Uncharacterized protein n=1 Tax=Melastoma candidum TaxID=119954 RepID=A0ACB9R003_9MYRT|nr:hypothetical protein MLD38_019280 [Melastoma candidum]